MVFCGCKQTKKLKVEADFSADALWCNKCSSNLDIESFYLSKELKIALRDWIYEYGKWIDWENGGIVQGGVLMEEKHNEQGLLLTDRVKKELVGQYTIIFSPATFAKRHMK